MEYETWSGALVGMLGSLLLVYWVAGDGITEYFKQREENRHKERMKELEKDNNGPK
jgi:hypothetical protein